MKLINSYLYAMCYVNSETLEINMDAVYQVIFLKMYITKVYIKTSQIQSYVLYVTIQNSFHANNS